MARYSQAAAQGGSGQDVVKEFKTMVKECHKRGIEVLMDVVLNHTAEGNERGPTLSFRWGNTILQCCAEFKVWQLSLAEIDATIDACYAEHGILAGGIAGAASYMPRM